MSSTIYDIFPREIWVLIILEIPYKLIPNLYGFISEDLCIEENILDRRKLKGYPRKSGHSELHHKVKLSDTNKRKIQNNHSIATKSVLNEVLLSLYENNTDLIRGDLICGDLTCTNTDVSFVFDGENIIRIENNILPQDFDLIIDEIPMEYWKNHNFVFCFNNHLVRDQTLNNITYDELYKITFTWFIFNKQYYVILSPNKNNLKNNNVFLRTTTNFLKFNFEINDVHITNIYSC